MAHESARSFCFGGLIEVKKVYAFSNLGDLNNNTPQKVVEIQQNYECKMHSRWRAWQLLLAEGGGHGWWRCWRRESRRARGGTLLAQENRTPYRCYTGTTTPTGPNRTYQKSSEGVFTAFEPFSVCIERHLEHHCTPRTLELESPSGKHRPRAAQPFSALTGPPRSKRLFSFEVGRSVLTRGGA